MKAFLVALLGFGILQSMTGQTAVTDPKKNEALVTIGTMSALSLYNTYVAIGAVADAYGRDVYTAQNVGDLMKEQLTILPTAKAQVEKLKYSGYLEDQTDIDYCQSIMDCLDLLILEAGGLSEYALHGDLDAQLNYANAREDAWELITKILQL